MSESSHKQVTVPLSQYLSDVPEPGGYRSQTHSIDYESVLTPNQEDILRESIAGEYGCEPEDVEITDIDQFGDATLTVYLSEDTTHREQMPEGGIDAR